MSSMPSQSNEVAVTPIIENPELCPEESELEEDPEKIQWEADVHIAVVRVHNERRWLEQEDQQWKEEEEQKKQEEEEDQKWKEEEDRKKEKADKDTYKEKLVEAHQMQLKVSPEFFIPCSDLSDIQILKKQRVKCKA